ncbi:type II toxin-antitoxin system RelE/ParE family toxin [Piscirickettsia salmonis]|uniref:Addiction module toxin RelE n=1 Tax=Piscirickettsia salmonis TaxID=1238 RepID=A0AAC9EVJ4_PISSA|nr:addiction module toxin RelE [Piscirickettsia salmonis]
MNKWAKKERITDSDLIAACKEIENGLFDADLGGGLIKKRVAIQGQGKSSGSRTLVAYKKGKHILFLYGFKKNQRSNITDKEERLLKEVAKEFFKRTEKELEYLITCEVYFNLEM